MKRIDEFNNYKVLNSDGTEHFDESFISTAETGKNAPENYSEEVSENEKFYETADIRESSDNSFDGYGEYDFSENEAIQNGLSGGSSGAAVQAVAKTAAASSSVFAGVAASIASVIAAVVVAVAIFIPSFKVSQIFAGSSSMAFSVEFSSELRSEEEHGVFWYAVLEDLNDIGQSVDLWEKTSHIEFYNLTPDTPYTLKIYRVEEGEDGHKIEERYSDVFYTAKEEQNEIFIEVFNEGNGLSFTFFDSDEVESKLYTVRAINDAGKVFFVEDVNEPNVFYVDGFEGEGYITVSVGGEVKAMRSFYVTRETDPQPFDPEYYVINFVADGEVVYTRSYRYGEDITYIPDVPYRKGFKGYWQQYEQGYQDILMYAYYEPEYEYRTITYMVDGEFFDSINYIVGTDMPSIDVPYRQGCTGEWEYREDADGNIIAVAVYTQMYDDPTYGEDCFTVYYMVNGDIVDSREYTKDIPAIPTFEYSDGNYIISDWDYSTANDGSGDIYAYAILPTN